MSSLKFIYFDFKGRIDRATWWKAWVLLLLAEIAFNYVLSKLMNDDAPMLDGTWPNLVRSLGDKSGWITAVIFLIPNIAMNTKRFHDRGLSGWWWLLFLIPFLAGTAISISPYGGTDWPSPLAGYVQLLSGFTALWTLITLGFLPSKAPRT
jgi:uncharacterized membrane protein YhaH (DUF805 family)